MVIPAQFAFFLVPSSLYFATEGELLMLWFLTLTTVMLTLSLTGTAARGGPWRHGPPFPPPGS